MRTLLKIISLSLVVSISLFANIPKIDECKSDVYYANGIMLDMDISEEEHDAKWKGIVKKLFLSNPEEYKKIANAKISYNRSQGFDDDIYESLEQAMSNEWGWEKFSIFFRTYLETHNIQEKYDTHIPDLSAQVTAYKESIKLGHGVIVIAHSQGNYYTNEAYEKLDEWMKDYFHMFGVATPANHVAGFPVDDAAAPYVLFHNDFINFIVTALPSNLNDTNPEHNNFPSIEAHDFYESYMKEETSKKMINDFIIDEIQKHSKNDSQWELDQELNKGTKDYKITLKHRFDTSIISMQDIEVYPFKPSQKLYHVTDNTGGNGWVKATCGGEEVFDSWIGQESNEAYLIDNFEREKIISSTLSFIIEYYYDIRQYQGNTKGSDGQKFITNTECAYGETGSSERNINLQSDEYYLDTALNYVRKNGEYYGVNRYPNVNGNIMRTLQCVINSNGAKLEDFSSVTREAERRYIIEDYGYLHHKRFVLEEKYSMVPN